jgi:RND family efflux transporter MFP subunit
MRLSMRTIVVLSAVLLVAACGRKRDVQLPPAQGPGAAALPALPDLPKDDSEGGDRAKSSPEATTVAPTEGRTTGTTFPRAEAQIGPKASGVIEKVFVNEGARVKRGMVLFRQETRDGELRVDQAKAAREAARVSLQATETEYARAKQLFEKNAASRMEWDQVQARMDGARVGVQQADVALAMAEKSLSDATIRSPIDGVVTAKLKSDGETATMVPPTVILVVQDQSTLELRFRLPEKALRQVKRGDVVTARFDALGVTRAAKVSRINSALDARTRTVEVVADIPNRDGSLKSGLLAEVELAGAGGGSAAAGPETTAVREGKPRAPR